MINGINVYPLKQIMDQRGKVMHMLRCDAAHFEKFGEIYFSVVNPGMIKAWKRHRKMTQHFAVPIGKIRLVIFDDREKSNTYHKLEILEIGEDNYSLVKIPPLVWYGFMGISQLPALIANCTDLPHDPDESESIKLTENKIPYLWKSE